MEKRLKVKNKNLWSVYRDPIIEWEADLSNHLNNPEILFFWQKEIIKSGENEEIFTVNLAPLIGYDRSENNNFCSFIKTQYENKKILNLFNFTNSGYSLINGQKLSVETLLSYFDSAGNLTEKKVENIGELIAKLDDPAMGFIKRPKMPPIQIYGPLINFEDLHKSKWSGKPGSIKIKFSLHSDIWFPKVPALYSDDYQPNKFQENSTLANLNAPRLNKFIKDVNELTESISCQWYLNQDWCNPLFFEMVSEDGIIFE